MNSVRAPPSDYGETENHENSCVDREMVGSCSLEILDPDSQVPA